MANMQYPLTVRVFYRDLTFDTTAEEIDISVTGMTYPQKITLYQNKTDYVLRLNTSIYIIDDAELKRRPDLANDSDHVVITGRRPDGSIITVNNIALVLPEPSSGNNRVVVNITGDPQITSTLGKTEYLIQFYTSDNELICSGRFDVTIVTATGVALAKKQIVIGLHHGRVPPVIRVSQNDLNTQLVVQLDLEDAVFTPTKHVKDGKIISDTGSSQTRIFLKGKRPDGQEASVVGTLVSTSDVYYKINNKMHYSLTFNLTNDFTNIAGRTKCQIYFFYGYIVYNVTTKITSYTPYSELYSMPFYIDVEPAP